MTRLHDPRHGAMMPSDHKPVGPVFAGDAPSSGAPRPPTLWRAFAGFGIWAVCFTLLYTGHALACTYLATASWGSAGFRDQSFGVTWWLAAAWLVFVLWLVLLSGCSATRVRAVQRCARTCPGNPVGVAWTEDRRLQHPASIGWTRVRRRSLRFMVFLTLSADLSSVVITVVSGLPVILTPACL